MQLDAFLRSAQQHAPYASIDVLWAASNTRHAAAYKQCAHEQSAVTWEPEFVFGFATLVRAFLDAHASGRVVFHTDDEVFYRTPPRELFDNDEDVITLRQGANTTYCQVLDVEQQIPAGFPRWRWREAEHDFAYPLSLNATVYMAEWIRPLLDFSFANPTRLEAGLACNAARLGVEYMVAPEHSCTVALPHNVVSVDSGCPRGGNPDWQPDALRAAYLDGYRIDLTAMDFADIRAAHQEVPLVLMKGPA